jgi:hypothetical protein
VISPKEFSAASLNPKGFGAETYLSIKSSGSLKLKKSDIIFIVLSKTD